MDSQYKLAYRNMIIKTTGTGEAVIHALAVQIVNFVLFLCFLFLHKQEGEPGCIRHRSYAKDMPWALKIYAD